MKPVLLAGETFLITSLAATGVDVGTSASFANGAGPFRKALGTAGIELVQLGAERCEAEFPTTLAELDAYSAVVLSDIGALSLLLTPQTRAGLPGVNRLELLRGWVESGGGVMMAGGYTSFQGMHGTARFAATPLEDCLPVRCLPYADGLEAPEGLSATTAASPHPLLDQVPGIWPPLLGMNRVSVLADSRVQTLATVSYRGAEHPLLVTRAYGLGRSLAWTSDIGTHWLSRPFLDWSGYDILMSRMILWVAGQI